jgi:hypothetical protein
MTDVGNFTAIWNIFWPFGIFCGHFGAFLPFWYVVQRKIWQPCVQVFSSIKSSAVRK